MANAPVYVVRTTQVPGVAYRVSKAEYDYLVELGLVASLDEVVVPADQVVITDGQVPANPAVGTVWFDRSQP